MSKKYAVIVSNFYPVCVGHLKTLEAVAKTIDNVLVVVDDTDVVLGSTKDLISRTIDRYATRIFQGKVSTVRASNYASIQGCIESWVRVLKSRHSINIRSFVYVDTGYEVGLGYEIFVSDFLQNTIIVDEFEEDITYLGAAEDFAAIRLQVVPEMREEFKRYLEYKVRGDLGVVIDDEIRTGPITTSATFDFGVSGAAFPEPNPWTV